MIVDRIENADLYKTLSHGIEAGLDYIENTDLDALASGIYVLPEGLKAIISEYESKGENDAKPEAHKKYIDIQYIISGEELIGYTPLRGQKPSIPYDSEKDLVFYNEEVSYTKMETGMFAIYWPGDIHQPGVQFGEPEPVKKLVLKIPI